MPKSRTLYLVIHLEDITESQRGRQQMMTGQYVWELKVLCLGNSD